MPPKSATKMKVHFILPVIFLDLHLSISNGFVSSKIYDTRDDFDFDVVNFPFLDGDVPRRPLMECIFLNLLDLLECVFT